MEWIPVNDRLPAGEYIVKTKTMFGWNVMKATLVLDEKGRPSWSCKRQDVTHYLGEPEHRYLILSGEGNHNTEHQFCMDCGTLEEANAEFDNFKNGAFKETYLFIYKAEKIREE